MVPIVQSRVLIIDDDEGMRFTVSAILAEYDVSLAPSARDAVVLLESLVYDAVLCDVMMPVMTGAELYESLPPDSPMRSRFVFMTGGALPCSMRSFLALRAVPVLQKPFGVEELRKAVGSVLGG